MDDAETSRVLTPKIRAELCSVTSDDLGTNTGAAYGNEVGGTYGAPVIVAVGCCVGLAVEGAKVVGGVGEAEGEAEATAGVAICKAVSTSARQSTARKGPMRTRRGPRGESERG